MLLSAILLSIAVSMDGLSAGFAYGMRSLRIPFFSLLVIAFSSASAMVCSMFLGRGLSVFLPLNATILLGRGVLMALGGAVIYSSLLDKKKAQRNHSDEPVKRSLLSFWRNPEEADLDKSGVISLGEALLLGSILATDAFAAGLGASFMGLTPLLTGLFVGLSKIILINLGLCLGRRSLELFSTRKASLVAGFILIFMGFIGIIR